MSCFEKHIFEKGKEIGDRFCMKYGFKTRRIESKNDLFAPNLSITFNPSKKKIKIKSTYL